MENQEANHMAETVWQPYEGVMVAYGVQPKTIVAYLRQLNVVSEVDWFGDTPHLMGINVLADNVGMVASLQGKASVYTPGIMLSELVGKLAETFNADVRIGSFNANHLPDSAVLNNVSGESEQNVRVVEITNLSMERVPFCAIYQNLNVAALKLVGNKTAVCYEVPAAKFYPEMMVCEAPLVKLWVDAKDEKILALDLDDNGEVYSRSHSWKMRTEIVAGEAVKPDSALGKQIRLDLGHGESPSFIAKIAGCEEKALIDSFNQAGSKGFIEATQVLKIPVDIVSFLQGKLELAEISTAKVFSGQGWVKAWQNSVDLQENYSLKSGPLPLIRRFAGQHPLLSTVLNVLEAVIGLGIIGLGGYSLQKRQGYSKLLIIGGVLLLADSALKGILGDPVGKLTGGYSPVSKNSQKNCD